MANWLWAIPVFGVIILIHELGHFAAAKAFGIRVHEFAIGFGPAFASLTRGETRYSLRAFLILGGFVRMAGMEDGDTSDPRGFIAKPVWQRMIVIAAGPVMNFVLAILLFGMLKYAVGIPSSLPIVGSVRPGDPAARAGIVAGDRFLAIGGQPVTQWNQVLEAVRNSQGRPLLFKVLRQEQTLEVLVTPVFDRETSRYIVGIAPAVVRPSVVTALVDGGRVTGIVIREYLVMLGRLIRGTEKADLMGPVGIVAYIAEARQQGYVELVSLASQLSINIGLLNLLPIPALDGSRLAFLAVEAVRRRRLDPTRENLVHFVGFLLLLGLIAAITVSDFRRFF